jgi:predicted nucleic acid-binding protein
MIILDTNVLSEALRPAPSAKVLEWMRAEPSSALFTTAITEAELLYGIALLPGGRRRQSLEAIVDVIFTEDLAGRVLPFDSAAAHEFAGIAADRRRAGRPISEADARIAAIARSRGAALATRNVGDFVGCGLTLIDPWV